MKWHRFLFIMFYLCNIIEKLRTTRFGASFLWTFILSSALKSDKMLHLADTILWVRDMDSYKISVVQT